MPAKGKHRRPKSKRFTRSIAVAGTGGAALALPLMGAAGAHAATGQSVTEKAAGTLTATQESLPRTVTEQPVAQQTATKTATPKSGAHTYSVKVGDYLAKIAEEQDVTGGWQRIYDDNREAVGSDPSLIHPGLKLSIGKKAADRPAGTDTQASKPAESSDSTASQKTQKSEESNSSQAQGDASSSGDQSTTTANASGFSLPVAGAAVGTPYRMAGSMWSSGYHTGVDFVVPTGTSLKSVGSGTVVSAGWGGAYGNQVVIKLADGFYAQYAHLSSLSVSQGQSVSAGTQVGLSGATGNVTGPHLHFEIRTTPDYGSDVDPVAYLRSHGLSVG
ncbi:peptidoglycan DD-metalloendopeptidase family protein [Streptomyces sp. NPDC088387]|uniref:M23 family metallopeptidase n=1 Tax=Streptomyces sp. NPDC088387 TaxID=3365859 RepID=UPI00380645CD